MTLVASMSEKRGSYSFFNYSTCPRGLQSVCAKICNLKRVCIKDVLKTHKTFSGKFWLISFSRTESRFLHLMCSDFGDEDGPENHQAEELSEQELFSYKPSTCSQNWTPWLANPQPS